MEVRPILDSDFASCVGLFSEAWNDLHRSFGFEEDVSDDDSWLLKPLRHFLRTDPDGGLIAFDDAGPAAFASSIRRANFWFLAFLFVHPRAQGCGIGSALLRRLLPNETDVVLATEIESFQAVAAALYARVGMVPASVKVYLSGPPRPTKEPSDRSIDRSEMSVKDLDDVNSIDEIALGFRRPEDHRVWMEWMDGTVYRRGNEVVGYSYDDDGYIAPALGIDEETLLAILGIIASASASPDQLQTAVWPSRHLLPSLLNSGWRIEGSKYAFLFLSSAGALPSSYISHSGWLP